VLLHLPAASAGANDNSSGWGDYQKPLDMLLEEEIELWKEKLEKNNSMKEGTQEDVEIDNEETGRSESVAALGKTVMKMISAGGVEVMQIKLNGYQLLSSKNNKQRTKYEKCAITGNKVFKNQIW